MAQIVSMPITAELFFIKPIYAVSESNEIANSIGVTSKGVHHVLVSTGNTMRHVMLTVAISLAVVATPAIAQDTRDGELAQADARLNATYKTLIDQLGDQDRATLRAAQRAWIALRDLDCEVGWADRRDCLIARTDERERQLRGSIYWTPRGELIELQDPRD